MALKYESLSDALTRRIEAEKRTGSYERMGFENSMITRRNILKKDSGSIWRPPFVHDIDKILHCP